MDECTFKDGAQFPYGDAPLAHELSQSHLKEKQRRGPADQVDEVGNQKGSAPVLVAQVGEPPDVAEAHCEPDTRQDKLPAIAPNIPLHHLRGRDLTLCVLVHHDGILLALCSLLGHHHVLKEFLGSNEVFLISALDHFILILMGRRRHVCIGSNVAIE